MFLGPLDAEKPWSTDGLIGAKKFIDRVYRMFEFLVDDDQEALEMSYHQTVKKVTEDYEKLAFNTAISQMMIFVNDVYKHKKIGKKQARNFLKLLNPICPHVTEEINATLLSVHEELVYSDWPRYDDEKTKSDVIEVVVQVNGKLRAKMQVARDTNQDALKKLSLEQENVKKHLEGLTVFKIIAVVNKLVNIVAK
jgi:leucyl-tRNA synthetase